MSEEKPCPISHEQVSTKNWGEIFGEPKPVHIYDCPRCGQFAVALLHGLAIKDIPNEERRKVAAYLRERNLQKQKEEIVVIGFGDQPQYSKAPTAVWITWEDAVAAFPKTPAEQLDRTLLNLARRSIYLGSPIVIDAYSEPLAFAENNEAMWFIFKQLIDDGLVKPYGSEISRLVVTVSGLDRVASLQSSMVLEKKT